MLCTHHAIFASGEHALPAGSVLDARDAAAPPLHLVCNPAVRRFVLGLDEAAVDEVPDAQLAALVAWLWQGSAGRAAEVGWSKEGSANKAAQTRQRK